MQQLVWYLKTSFYIPHPGNKYEMKDLIIFFNNFNNFIHSISNYFVCENRNVIILKTTAVLFTLYYSVYILSNCCFTSSLLRCYFNIVLFSIWTQLKNLFITYFTFHIFELPISLRVLAHISRQIFSVEDNILLAHQLTILPATSMH